MQYDIFVCGQSNSNNDIPPFILSGDSDRKAGHQSCKQRYHIAFTGSIIFLLIIYT